MPHTPPPSYLKEQLNLIKKLASKSPVDSSKIDTEFNNLFEGVVRIGADELPEPALESIFNLLKEIEEIYPHPTIERIIAFLITDIDEEDEPGFYV